VPDRDAALVFFSLATVLNLAFMLWLWRSAPRGRSSSDLLFPSGIAIEAFTATSRGGSEVEVGRAANSAYAFIFLSKACPKCRGAAPAVMDVARRSAGRGVAVWIATAERLSSSDLGQDPDCEHFFLDLPRITYAMLNPRRASPAYLFIGADMVAQASGFIGDENWLSFEAQLGESRERRAR
jgi:hypothetical protein